MNNLINLAGSAAGVLGALLCAVAGLARVAGVYHLASFEATTLFTVGTGLMVFACLLKLELLLRSRAP